MSSYLMRYSVLYELNTLDACWIAVDVWSNSSRCRIISVYLTRTWCLCLWSCLDILITMRFSINCSTIICSPTVIFAILREATSETYGPRVYFPSYKFPIYKPKIFPLSFIYLYQISLLQVTVKGLTTPLSRCVQVVDCLCRYSVTCA